MIFHKGDLVSVKIEILLEDHMNMIGMLAYKARSEIYGVVRETDTNDRCRVSWSMQRMFNLEKDELNVDYEYIGNTHLTIVKKGMILILIMIGIPIPSLITTKKDGNRHVGCHSDAIFA